MPDKPIFVALLARDPGLIVLRHCLLRMDNIRFAAIATHGKLPLSEGGGERPELSDYRKACQAAGVPLLVLDGAAAGNLAACLPEEELDGLLCLSWRHLVRDDALSRFRLGGVNIHRGALPGYAGAEPVRRAIEAGEKRFAVTAHRMTNVIDGGDILATAWIDGGDLDPSQDIKQRTQTVKERLYPLYAPIAELAVNCLLASR